MKLEMTRAWNDATRLLRASREVILIVAGVFFFLPYFAFMVMTPDPFSAPGAVTPADADALVKQFRDYYSQIWWVVLIVLVLQAVGMIGLIALLTDRRRPTVGEALKTGASRMPSYIAAYMLVGLAMGAVVMLLAAGAAATGLAALATLALLVALIAWIVLFIRVSMVAPVLAKENVVNPLTALKRSWAMTRGNGVRLFGFFFLLVVTYVVLIMLATIVAGTLFGLMGNQIAQFGDAFVMSLLNAAWVTVFLAVLSAVHDQFAGISPSVPDQTFG
jgi:hypothetical protein